MIRRVGRTLKQIRARLRTTEFQVRSRQQLGAATGGHHGLPLIDGARAARNPRWSDGELERLMNNINAAGNPYDYRGIQLFHNERSVPSITSKVNGLYNLNRIVIRDGLYVLLPKRD